MTDNPPLRRLQGRRRGLAPVDFNVDAISVLTRSVKGGSDGSEPAKPGIPHVQDVKNGRKGQGAQDRLVQTTLPGAVEAAARACVPELEDFLRHVGASRYAEALRSIGVTVPHLLCMQEAQIRAAGVSHLGPLRSIQHYARSLRARLEAQGTNMGQLLRSQDRPSRADGAPSPLPFEVFAFQGSRGGEQGGGDGVGAGESGGSGRGGGEVEGSGRGGPGEEGEGGGEDSDDGGWGGEMGEGSGGQEAEGGDEGKVEGGRDWEEVDTEREGLETVCPSQARLLDRFHRLVSQTHTQRTASLAVPSPRPCPVDSPPGVAGGTHAHAAAHVPTVPPRQGEWPDQCAGAGAGVPGSTCQRSGEMSPLSASPAKKRAACGQSGRLTGGTPGLARSSLGRSASLWGAASEGLWQCQPSSAAGGSDTAAVALDFGCDDDGEGRCVRAGGAVLPGKEVSGRGACVSAMTGGRALGVHAACDEGADDGRIQSGLPPCAVPCDGGEGTDYGGGEVDTGCGGNGVVWGRYDLAMGGDGGERTDSGVDMTRGERRILSAHGDVDGDGDVDLELEALLLDAAEQAERAAVRTAGRPPDGDVSAHPAVAHEEVVGGGGEVPGESKAGERVGEGWPGRAGGQGADQVSPWSVTVHAQVGSEVPCTQVAEEGAEDYLRPSRGLDGAACGTPETEGCGVRRAYGGDAVAYGPEASPQGPWRGGEGVLGRGGEGVCGGERVLGRGGEGVCGGGSGAHCQAGKMPAEVLNARYGPGPGTSMHALGTGGSGVAWRPDVTPVGGATGSTGVEPGADSRMLPADALEAPVDAHETPAGLHMRPMDARTLPTDKCGLSGGAIGHMHGVPSGGSEGGERQQDGGLTEAQRQRIAANRARALARRNARISGTRSGAEEPPSRLALAGAGLGQAPSRTEPSTQGVTADATADSQRLLSTQAAPASLTVPCLGSPRIGTHAQDGVERAAMGRAALASTVAPALHGGGTVPVVDPNVTLNDAGGSHSLGTDVHHEERVTGPGAEASVDEQRAREVELSRVDGQLEAVRQELADLLGRVNELYALSAQLEARRAALGAADARMRAEVGTEDRDESENVLCYVGSPDDWPVH